MIEEVLPHGHIILPIGLFVWYIIYIILYHEYGDIDDE